jgi:hypothetical protein
VGPQAAFGLAGLAGAAAVLLSLLRGATLPAAVPQPLYANVD